MLPPRLSEQLYLPLMEKTKHDVTSELLMSRWPLINGPRRRQVQQKAVLLRTRGQLLSLKGLQIQLMLLYSMRRSWLRYKRRQAPSMSSTWQMQALTLKMAGEPQDCKSSCVDFMLRMHHVPASCCNRCNMFQLCGSKDRKLGPQAPSSQAQRPVPTKECVQGRLGG